MSEYAEWNAGELYYRDVFAIISEYQRAMSISPPDVTRAYRMLSQLYDSIIFAIKKENREEIESLLSRIRSRLFSEDYTRFGGLPAFRERSIRDKQESIDELREIYRSLIIAMDDKKMIIPKNSNNRPVGYQGITAGGIRRDG